MLNKEKDIRIRSNDELESQVQTLKEYYGVKSKSGAIKKAIRDCSMIAKHKSFECNCGEGMACSSCNK